MKHSITESELQEYMEVVQTIKELEVRKEELKALLTDRGSFCSRNYVCSVTDQSRTGLVGLEHVEKALGRDILEYHELIRITHFKVVKVSRIAKMFRLATIS